MIIKKLLTFALLLPLVFSCGITSEEGEDEGDDYEDEQGTSAGTLQVGPITTIPTVIDPVLPLEGDSKTDSFNSGSSPLTISLDLTTTSTGVSLGSETSLSTYQGLSSPSFGSCEMVNRLRGILHEAATADDALCDLHTMIDGGISDSLIDGTTKIIEITDEEEDDLLIKFKASKTGDKVTSLELHSCSAGKQDLYLKKEVDADKNVTIFAKRRGTDSGGSQNISYAFQVNVTGTVDDDGKLVGLKELSQAYSNDFNSDGSDVSYNEYKLVQSSSNIALKGFATQTTAENPTLLLAFFDLIDNNTDGTAYDLKKLSVGAGAILYNRGSLVSEGWAADGSKDSSSKWITKVGSDGSKLPSAPSSSAEHKNLNFSGEEVWDCTGTADLSIADGSDDDDDPCGNFELPQSQSVYLECSNFENN